MNQEMPDPDQNAQDHYEMYLKAAQYRKMYLKVRDELAAEQQRYDSLKALFDALVKTVQSEIQRKE
jgi:hypothetical protein